MPKLIDDAWVAIDGMKYLLFVVNFLIWVSYLCLERLIRGSGSFTINLFSQDINIQNDVDNFVPNKHRVWEQDF